MNPEVVEDKILTHEKRLNDHSKRIDNLEVCQGKTDVKIDNLCKNLSGLTKALWAVVACIMTTLLGFFVYAIQQNIF